MWELTFFWQDCLCDGCAKSRLIYIRLGKIDYKVGNTRPFVMYCFVLKWIWLEKDYKVKENTTRKKNQKQRKQGKSKALPILKKRQLH